MKLPKFMAEMNRAEVLFIVFMVNAVVMYIIARLLKYLLT